MLICMKWWHNFAMCCARWNISHWQSHRDHFWPNSKFQRYNELLKWRPHLASLHAFPYCIWQQRPSPATNGKIWAKVKNDFPSCARYGVPSESLRQNVVVLSHCAIVCHIVPHGSSHNGRPPPKHKTSKDPGSDNRQNNGESLMKNSLLIPGGYSYSAKPPFFANRPKNIKTKNPVIKGIKYL